MLSHLGPMLRNLGPILSHLGLMLSHVGPVLSHGVSDLVAFLWEPGLFLCLTLVLVPFFLGVGSNDLRVVRPLGPCPPGSGGHRLPDR